MNRHRPALGIVFMLGGCFLLTLNDAISKLLMDRLSVAQVIFGKNVLVVFGMIALAAWVGASRVFSLADWQGQLARSALTVASAFLFLLGLMDLPLSTAVMLGFVAPLYMTALAPWVLGETVGIHRWAAVCVGFLGVVIVCWPSSEGFSYAVLYPLGSALTGALRDLMTRRMSLRSTSESMIFYSVTAMTLAGGAATQGDIFSVSVSDWLQLAAAAIASVFALYLQIEAFRNAEAATVAPFKYSNLLWVTLLDVLLWGHFPSWNVFVGAAVMTAAMLYIYRRERVTAAPTVEPPPPSPVG